MGIQPVPQNQLDALPLITVAQASSGGDVTVLGGQILRRFTPAVLGVNGAAASSYATPAALNVPYLVTPFLDVTGCTNFAFVLMITNTTAGNLTPPTQSSLYAQMRLGPTDAPPLYQFTTANADDNIHIGSTIMPAANRIWPTVVPAQSWRQVWTFGASSATTAADATGNQPTLLGSEFRLIVKMSPNAAMPDPGLVYTLYGVAHS